MFRFFATSTFVVKFSKATIEARALFNRLFEPSCLAITFLIPATSNTVLTAPPAITPEPSNEEASTIKDASDDNTENRSNGEHSSLEDPTGDPTKPDLLGDISDESESKTNGLETQEVSEPQHVSHNDDGLEKGIVDMNISEQAKEEEIKIMNA